MKKQLWKTLISVVCATPMCVSHWRIKLEVKSTAPTSRAQYNGLCHALTDMHLQNAKKSDGLRDLSSICKYRSTRKQCIQILYSLHDHMHVVLTALFPLQNNTENVKTYLIKKGIKLRNLRKMQWWNYWENVSLWWPFTSGLGEIQVFCENGASRWFCSKSLKEYPNFTVKRYRESKGGERCLFPPVLLTKAGELREESCTGQILSDGMTLN